MTEPRTQRVQFFPVSAGDRSSTQVKEFLIVAKARELFAEGKTILIAAPANRIEALSRMLWELSPESFLPHGVLPCELNDLSIFLTHRPCQIEGVDVLLVASPLDQFDWMMQFGHVIDFVEQDIPTLRDESRSRFKRWRERGLSPVFEKS